MILVPLLNPKFATVLAEKSCELRVRGTSVAGSPAGHRRLDRLDRGAGIARCLDDARLLGGELVEGRPHGVDRVDRHHHGAVAVGNAAKAILGG